MKNEIEIEILKKKEEKENRVIPEIKLSVMVVLHQIKQVQGTVSVSGKFCVMQLCCDL